MFNPKHETEIAFILIWAYKEKKISPIQGNVAIDIRDNTGLFRDTLDNLQKSSLSPLFVFGQYSRIYFNERNGAFLKNWVVETIAKKSEHAEVGLFMYTVFESPC